MREQKERQAIQDREQRLAEQVLDR